MFNKIELELFKYKNFILSSSKFYSIEYLRAFAALSVVIFHIEEYLNSSNLIEIKHNFFSWGAIGVQIFFVLSGFIIPFSIYRKERKPSSFIYSRFIRIYPTYLFILFFI